MNCARPGTKLQVVRNDPCATWRAVSCNEKYEPGEPLLVGAVARVALRRDVPRRRAAHDHVCDEAWPGRRASGRVSVGQHTRYAHASTREQTPARVGERNEAYGSTERKQTSHAPPHTSSARPARSKRRARARCTHGTRAASTPGTYQTPTRLATRRRQCCPRHCASLSCPLSPFLPLFPFCRSCLLPSRKYHQTKHKRPPTRPCLFITRTHYTCPQVALQISKFNLERNLVPCPPACSI